MLWLLQGKNRAVSVKNEIFVARLIGKDYKASAAKARMGSLLRCSPASILKDKTGNDLGLSTSCRLTRDTVKIAENGRYNKKERN